MWNEANLNPPSQQKRQRPPLPPFTLETARLKVQLAEDLWNSRDPELVSMAYSVDAKWRNRSEFITGREQIIAFLTAKWKKELDYRLKKELWNFAENRIAVRFLYESHDESGQWYRSYGIELWDFNENGLMVERTASINDAPINENERIIF
ncbi:nuclear transport factor 2 family protein [Dyadobacter sp. CY345]|uniref:DUF1348 family protein n=1 Tax=Dyadobacter sp. CY345 TaxID=2909335 RepID=UPI001F2DF4E1|nr:nuclear transport factor 2 family protein [Dyadobacter sp. CY345]